MKVLVASDAWHPQVNGVVRVFERLIEDVKEFNAEIDVMGPAEWANVPLPTYSEIKLALCTQASVGKKIEARAPDFIHIATEGPVGYRTAQYCRANGIPYTTSYHTKFPEYVRARLPVPITWSYAYLRRLHNGGKGVMVTNHSLKRELEARDFKNIMIWSRGVNCVQYRPMERNVLDLPRPIFLYVGRVAVEKNLDAFLSLDLPGTKVVTGTGPQLDSLKSRYPDVVFTGLKTGDDLVAVYSSADVFVFPSRTDTFGMVLLESLACGLPVAAYPVTGPRDVVGTSGCGVLSEDLREAALGALEISREACRAYAQTHSLSRSAGDFLNNVRVAHGQTPLVAAVDAA